MSNGNTIRKAALALLSMQRHSWEQGVAMQAFLEMGEMDTVAAMAVEAVYRSMEDGRAATIGVTDGVTDPCATGSGILAAYKNTGKKELKEGYDRLLIWALEKAPRNEAGILYHLTTRHEFWADSIYMLPPFLAEAGYVTEALQNLLGYWDTLYDPEAHLMCHMWDDDRKVYVREAHWGTGSGWALAALVRMDGLLDGRYDREKELLRSMFRELLDGVLKWKRPNGFFGDVLDAEESFSETNLVQMTAYSIYRGMMQQMIPDTYLEEADLLREAANSKVTEDGFVHDVCGAPGFDKPGFSPEGQAFYLMMEQACREWADSRKGEKNNE